MFSFCTHIYDIDACVHHRTRTLDPSFPFRIRGLVKGGPRHCWSKIEHVHHMELFPQLVWYHTTLHSRLQRSRVCSALNPKQCISGITFFKADRDKDLCSISFALLPFKGMSLGAGSDRGRTCIGCTRLGCRDWNTISVWRVVLTAKDFTETLLCVSSTVVGMTGPHLLLPGLGALFVCEWSWTQRNKFVHQISMEICFTHRTWKTVFSKLWFRSRNVELCVSTAQVSELIRGCPEHVDCQQFKQNFPNYNVK